MIALLAPPSATLAGASIVAAIALFTVLIGTTHTPRKHQSGDPK